MPKYCDNFACDAEAVEAVPVSVAEDVVEARLYCYPCYEAYETGVQHGRFRAVRNLRAYAESLMAQGFATEAGVIFAAISKIDTAADPADETLVLPELDDEEEDDEDE